MQAYLTSLVRATGPRLILALTLMALVAATEGVGLVLLVPLLGVVGLDIEAGGTGRLARAVADLFRLAGLPLTMASVLAAFVVVVVVRTFLSRWDSSVSVALEYEFSANLRERLYRAIAGARWAFLVQRRSSDLVHVLTAEVDRVAYATMSILHLTGTILVFIAYAVVAIRLSWLTSALVLGCGMLLLAALRRKAHAAHDAGEQLTDAARQIYADAVEHLGAMKTVKSYGAERRTVERFSGHSQAVLRAYRLALDSHAAVRFWFDAGAVAVLAAMVYGAREVMGVSTATLLMLVFLFSRTVPRLGTIQQLYQVLLNTLPGFENVARTVRECEAAAETPAGRVETVKLRSEIRLERVSFRYGGGEAAAIEELDLVIPARRVTALVGSSGAGKTTVADLLMGLITPDEGSILIDGQVLGPDRIQGWREQIGYVPQDGLLFHDTVRANLQWARPGVTEAELHEALRLAAADEFVARLPQRLDTVVGDRGVLLSSGERQRLMLARALLRRPALLLLDEATSSIDFENERRIIDAIDNLKGRLTVLLITHRLSAVQTADLIYVLDRGRIIESGRWADLIGRSDGRLRVLAEAEGRGRSAAQLVGAARAQEYGPP